ncbi:MAG: hypothetical protein FJX57_00410 [Alphaproteobacteria bacterium]|nr:hypothetical protein [Alphaproteobacteria bacterium]
MTIKLDEDGARTMAAQAGVALDTEAARNAAVSMHASLALADGFARALAFEAEPGAYRGAQIRNGAR